MALPVSCASSALALAAIAGSFIGFLRGDVNGNQSVSAADTSQIRARAGQVASSTNFLADINASGVIGAADIAAAKVAVGRSLP